MAGEYGPRPRAAAVGMFRAKLRLLSRLPPAAIAAVPWLLSLAVGVLRRLKWTTKTQKWKTKTKAKMMPDRRRASGQPGHGGGRASPLRREACKPSAKHKRGPVSNNRYRSQRLCAGFRCDAGQICAAGSGGGAGGKRPGTGEGASDSPPLRETLFQRPAFVAGRRERVSGVCGWRRCLHRRFASGTETGSGGFETAVRRAETGGPKVGGERGLPLRQKSCAWGWRK